MYSCKFMFPVTINTLTFWNNTEQKFQNIFLNEIYSV